MIYHVQGVVVIVEEDVVVVIIDVAENVDHVVLHYLPESVKHFWIFFVVVGYVQFAAQIKNDFVLGTIMEDHFGYKK